MEAFMLVKQFNRITTLPIWMHAGAAIATIFGFNWIGARLDASYAASQHPVDYATGQTAFSGEVIKGYYAHMLELGTLDIYLTTQIIDFGFILAMACMGIFVCTLAARASRGESWGRRVGIVTGLCALAGALCDALENGLSFIMIANPTDFPNWLALPYSAFASAKFALITIAMLCVVISVLLAIFGRLTKKPSIG